MSKVPTAEEFLKERCKYNSITGFYELVELNDFIDFTKLHVEVALKQASVKAKIVDEGRYVLGDEDWHEDLVISKESILKAYSLDNIK